MNRAVKLRRADGSIVQDHSHVKSVAISYFHDLFASKDGNYAPLLS